MAWRANNRGVAVPVNWPQMRDTTTRGNACLTPGAVVGIVGGGQLGRMMAIAASRLGFFTPFCPNVNAPQLVSSTHQGDYDNRRALSELTERADVLTYELEQIPLGYAVGLGKCAWRRTFMRWTSLKIA